MSPNISTRSTYFGWSTHPIATCIAPLMLTSAGLGVAIVTFIVQVNPAIANLPAGTVDAGVRILADGQPVNVQRSMTSGAKFEVEMRAAREIPVYAWARGDDGRLIPACGGAFCGTMPADTHWMLPVRNGYFQFSSQIGRESVVLLFGAARTPPPDTAESVDALISSLERTAGACRGKVAPGNNDGQHWAEIRSWCDMPVVVELVLQHPR